MEWPDPGFYQIIIKLRFYFQYTNFIYGISFIICCLSQIAIKELEFTIIYTTRDTCHTHNKS